MRACATLGLEINEGIINIWLKPGQILGVLPQKVFRTSAQRLFDYPKHFWGGSKRQLPSPEIFQLHLLSHSMPAAMSLDFWQTSRSLSAFKSPSTLDSWSVSLCLPLTDSGIRKEHCVLHIRKPASQPGWPNLWLCQLGKRCWTSFSLSVFCYRWWEK